VSAATLHHECPPPHPGPGPPSNLSRPPRLVGLLP
jgi:hypothetical protein